MKTTERTASPATPDAQSQRPALLIAVWALLALAGYLVVISGPVRGHEDPPGNKMTDFARVTEVYADKDFEDGFIFEQDAEICIIAIFEHHGHNTRSFTVKIKVGDQVVEKKYEFFDIVEKCNDDVDMDGDEDYYLNGPPRGKKSWRLISDTGPNAITNIIQSARHDECTPRASWTVNVQGWEHDESEADILRKIAKALEGAAALPAAEKWAAPAKAGAALLELIASLFTNTNMGEVTLDFPPGEDGPKDREGGHLWVKADVKQEFPSGESQPCTPPTPSPSSSPSQTLTPTPSPSSSPTPTPSPTPAASPTGSTPSPTPTSTTTPTPTPSSTPTPTPTPTPSQTPSPTPTPTPSLTSTPSASPSSSITPTGTRRAQAADECTPAPDGLDAAHPFSRSRDAAGRSWDLLEKAARDVDEIGDIRKERTPHPRFLKKRLTKTIVNIARIVAKAELDEAEAIPATDEEVVADAQGLLEKGDSFREEAIDEVDPDLIGKALSRYRQAFDLLLGELHPECQP